MRKGGLYRPEGAKWYVRKRRVLPSRPRNPRREAAVAFVGRNLVLFIVIYLAASLAVN